MADYQKVNVIRLWAYRKSGDCFNEETFTTVEKAVKEAERLLDLEGKYYESIYISTEEEQDEDGLTGDHNMIWLNGKFID